MMTTIREQNGEMRSTQEELRQNVEELTATRESLELKNTQHEESLRDLEKAKSTLSLQQQSLRKILNELPLNIYLKDADGRYVLVNKGVAEKYKLTPEEMFGKSDFDLYTYEEAVKFRDQEMQVIQQGETHTNDVEVVGGVPKTYETTKKVFYIDFLKEYGLLGYQKDKAQISEPAQNA
jgi:PAS domain-containing protein